MGMTHFRDAGGAMKNESCLTRLWSDHYHQLQQQLLDQD
jgi:hypothetical protein